jgi:hypothetical protein
MRRTESETERQSSWWLSLVLPPERKAINYVRAHGRHTGDVMTREVITINDDALLQEIAALLERHRIKRGPVMRGDRLVGIVSRASLLHGLVARRTGGIPSDRSEPQGSCRTSRMRACELGFSTSSSPAGWFTFVATPQEKAAVRAAAESAPRVKENRANVDALPTYMRPFIRAG